MMILSTRKIVNNDWSTVNVDDGEPLYFKVAELASFDYRSVAHVHEADAVGALVEEARANSSKKPMVVVFVHGFNNTVQSAGRAANDLCARMLLVGQVSPAMAFLAWPSDGAVTEYKHDRNAARGAAPVASKIFLAISQHPEVRSGKVALNVIAHSMGNYVMNLTCESAGLGAETQPHVFSQSVSVAADINADDFNVGQEGDDWCKQSERLTFYYDGWDGTLELSESVYNHRWRLGKEGPHHWDQLNPNTIGVNCADVIRADTHDPISGAIEVAKDIHSSYFKSDTFFLDVSQVLSGVLDGSISTREHPAGVPPNSFRLEDAGTSPASPSTGNGSAGPEGGGP